MILICNSYPQDTLFCPFNYAGENIEKWKSTRRYLTLDNAIGFLRCIFTWKKANLIPLLLVLSRMEFKIIRSSFVQKKNVKGSVRNWFSVYFKKSQDLFILARSKSVPTYGTVFILIMVAFYQSYTRYLQFLNLFVVVYCEQHLSSRK